MQATCIFFAATSLATNATTMGPREPYAKRLLNQDTQIPEGHGPSLASSLPGKATWTKPSTHTTRPLLNQDTKRQGMRGIILATPWLENSISMAPSPPITK